MKTLAPLLIVCVCWSPGYGVADVRRLQDMCSRHVTVPHEFVVCTDEPMPADVRTFWPSDFAMPRHLTWQKATIFSPELCDVGQRVLYFDQDVTIERAVRLQSHEFVAIERGERAGVTPFRDFALLFTASERTREIYRRLHPRMATEIGGEESLWNNAMHGRVTAWEVEPCSHHR